MEGTLLPLLAVVAAFLFSGLRILKEYERGVLFVLGRSWGAKGPGLIWLPPVLTKMQKVSLRVIAMDIPPQDVITRDNISIKVNAVLYMRVVDPAKAIIGVENYLYATSQLAQKLAQAAHIIGREPAAIQLRYLQTVSEIASEKSSTTIFPVPIDLFRGILDAVGNRTGYPAALPEKTSGEAVPAPRSVTKTNV